MAFEFPIISADSHITEAPGTYRDYIDAAWREQAPKIVNDPELGDLFVAVDVAVDDEFPLDGEGRRHRRRQIP